MRRPGGRECRQEGMSEKRRKREHSLRLAAGEGGGPGPVSPTGPSHTSPSPARYLSLVRLGVQELRVNAARAHHTQPFPTSKFLLDSSLLALKSYSFSLVFKFNVVETAAGPESVAPGEERDCYRNWRGEGKEESKNAVMTAHFTPRSRFPTRSISVERRKLSLLRWMML